MRRLTIAGALGATLFCVTAGARAQSTAQDAVTAQALFDDGKRLMSLGKWSEACPKLVESQRLDPGGGTLFAIALCHEGEGKTATAWADFNVALTEARKDRRAERETAAQDHIRALEPKLTRVRVVPAAKLDGLEVKRDGAIVGEPQWGTPIPIDPGSHTFDAKAPGRTLWHDVVEIRGEGATIDVTIPALAVAATPAPAPVTPVAAAKPVSPPTSEPRASRDEGISQTTWAITAGAVGVVAAGVGLGFGVSANSKWDDVASKCPNNRCTSTDAKEKGDSAGKAADISTVLVSVGAVGIVAGVVLWLTAPSSRDTRSGTRMRVVPTATAQSVGLSWGGEL